MAYTDVDVESADRPFAHRRLQDFEHGEWDEPHPRAVFLPRLGQLRLEHRVDAMADVSLVLSFPAFSRFTFFEEGEGSETGAAVQTAYAEALEQQRQLPALDVGRHRLSPPSLAVLAAHRLVAAAQGHPV